MGLSYLRFYHSSKETFLWRSGCQCKLHVCHNKLLNPEICCSGFSFLYPELSYRTASASYPRLQSINPGARSPWVYEEAYPTTIHLPLLPISRESPQVWVELIDNRSTLPTDQPTDRSTYLPKWLTAQHLSKKRRKTCNRNQPVPMESRFIFENNLYFKYTHISSIPCLHSDLNR